MRIINNPLIVALDVDTLGEAKGLVDQLSPVVDIFKVGSQLFTAAGPTVIEYILEKRKNVFLDLKFHDIPHTVANAVGAAIGLNQRGREKGRGICMLTVHTLGGKEMLVRAVRSADDQTKIRGVLRPLILGITVLTSDENKDNIPPIVLERALLAKDCGLDGVVASSQEAALIRQKLGKDFIIVTPGIRPLGSEAGDQKRITTPTQAVHNGSNFIVVGRPIVKALDPLQAAKDILEEIRKAQK